MTEEQHPFIRLLKEDRRYAPEAYQFVRDALSYGQEVLGLGSEEPTQPVSDLPEPDPDLPVERHMTGPQLCEGVRIYASEQYGYMASTVLKNWGLTSTSDIGEIVYNLINVGLMKRSDSDNREDFDDVYDFEEVFCKKFEIQLPEEL